MQDDKLVRATFSLSLARFLAKKYGGKVIRFTFQLGKKLERFESSDSNLYALVSKSKDLTLRIMLNKELAVELCDDSRYITECWLTEYKELLNCGI